ncbi:bifunctional transcriptional activator/DNA repair enzyme AdaA [Paenibacillus glycinis]|uniref:Helix-turn-helix domain-containing protein n=1 Tax=Paenibacillus glycinis TaxID=2697035 RepID=A0ABW9XLA1_9BACL|nr:Ada metal-binding domain-containing protein [Paenibacillus glycinis]NBD23394.1 helix-turn-helix domain-containing protein [Paenibacillus glycinis]
MEEPVWTPAAKQTETPDAECLTDAKWSAIVNSDAGQDGRFYYSVSTTRIFCRPSCRSRTPKRENVRVFGSAAAAVAAGYRPCKRCKPDGLRMPDEEWVNAIAESIRAHYPERITLQSLAEEQHVSLFHLQRTFKRIRGATPAEYLIGVRIEAAKGLLRESRYTVAEVGARVGISNAAHFATVFLKTVGRSPSQYRQELATPSNRKAGEDNHD